MSSSFVTRCLMPFLHRMAPLILSLPSCTEDAPTPPTLRITTENKFASFSTASQWGHEHFEASGVTFLDNYMYVIFDNSRQFAIVGKDLKSARFVGADNDKSAYEAISTLLNDSSTLFIVEEGDGSEDTIVYQTNRSNSILSETRTDLEFQDPNKGIEGLSIITVDGKEYLLALCEAPNCQSSTQDPGTGTIKVLQQKGSLWTTVNTITLPTSAAFEDYSDLALYQTDDDSFKIAVVSQQSSSLWVGTLKASPLSIASDGQVYLFPRDDDDNVLYCSIEGITFLDENTLVAVSDRSEDERCKAKSESIHLIQIP